MPFHRFPRLPRKTTIAAAVTVAALAVPAVAWAVVTVNPASTTYTACLSTSGAITKAKAGTAPASACADGESQISLGGGDITAVNTANGLTGGVGKGVANLGIAPKYRLPQGCTNGSVPAANSTGWECASTAPKVTDVEVNLDPSVQSLTDGFFSVVKNFSMQPGTYEVHGMIDLINQQTQGDIFTAECRLGSNLGELTTARTLSMRGFRGSVAINGTFTIDLTTNVGVYCRDFGTNDIRADFLSLTLTPVADVTTVN